MRRHPPAARLAVLGVVFGDIGTSPLYAIQACFHGTGLAATPANIIGLLSLVTWTLILVVSVKYVSLVMRADNLGEGGVLSLLVMALQRLPLLARASAVATALGMVGAAMFYGDSVITPAISVLSAVEGLEVLDARLHGWVLPLTTLILVSLFLIQQRGSERLGGLFGPVMLVWFAALALLGIAGIASAPEILNAVNPVRAMGFMMNHGWAGFFILSAVVLAVTGAEALYADMGHFGRPVVARAWQRIVMPALLLNYLGQGALLLVDPGAISNPFYNLVPALMLVPMILLASAATVIASQAVITGAFSITQQAIQLGFLPRLTVTHTSSRQIGQIYVPFVNWALLFAVLLCVLGFRSSSELAAAYGIAVTATMTVTTLLMWPVCRHLWLWPLPACLAVIVPMLTLDLAFFISNLPKLPQGGWLPVLSGILLLVVMNTWRLGRNRVAVAVAERGISRASFVESITRRPPARAGGSAVFLTRNDDMVPLALLNNLRVNEVLHDSVIMLTVRTLRSPYADEEYRLHIETLAPGLHSVRADFGFMERPDVPELVADCRARGLAVDPGQLTYFLSRETIVSQGGPTFPRWRSLLFAFLVRNGQSATEFFNLPAERVVEIGVQVDLQ
jgi:KUP system potassium uptake protein